MPINRIAIFSGLSAKQKKARKNFTECTRHCRSEAPKPGAYPKCLRACLKPKSTLSKSRRSRRR